MFNLTLACILLAGITATFWVLEAAPAYQGFRDLRPAQWQKGLWGLIVNPFVAIGYLGSWFTVLPKAKFLLIDIATTVLIVKIFSLGGLIGTTMGFMISNVISFALMIARKREEHIAA